MIPGVAGMAIQPPGITGIDLTVVSVLRNNTLKNKE